MHATYKNSVLTGYSVLTEFSLDYSLYLHRSSVERCHPRLELLETDTHTHTHVIYLETKSTFSSVLKSVR